MKSIKYYNINLDLPLKERWTEVIGDLESKFDNIRAEIKKLLTVYSNYLPLIKTGVNFIPRTSIHHYDEIYFFADLIGLEFYETLLMQLVYEISSACTTGLMKLKSGEFWFRTMDWDMMFLKDLTIGLNLTKNNKPIGSVITWFGYVGYLTVNTLSYNLAINYRRTKEFCLSAILGNFWRIIGMSWPIGYLIRDIVEKSTPVEEIQRRLEHDPLISPCYITFRQVGNKTTILARNPTDCEYIQKVKLCQTNCDYTKKEPNILWSIERREKFLEIEQKYKDSDQVTPEQLLDELLKFPILNEETIYCYWQYNDRSGSIIC